MTDVIRTTLTENLDMIESSVAYLKENSEEVIYDAEHFFDGYKANPEYAIETLRAAEKGEAIPGNLKIRLTSQRIRFPQIFRIAC